MSKILGIVFVFGGIAGYLYSWQSSQKKRRERVNAFLCFLQKSVFAMEMENPKIGQWFRGYQSREDVLNETLEEIANRLALNVYPKGQSVWEEVLWEKEQNWDLDHETFGFIINAGNGFFGKNRTENICFLQKSIKELEVQEEKNRQKDTSERKLWIPVGMLSGLMIVILFI